MRRVSRRKVLRAGMALGGLGLLSDGVLADEDDHSSDRHSPHLDRYVAPLPILEERTPDGRYRGAVYHEVELKEATHSFHPDLPDTTIWGFDGQFPGPILAARRWRRLAVKFDNSGLPDEHLLDIDEQIGGTTTENYVGYDGPVPEVRTVTHFHGLNVPPESDGQAEMWTSPDGIEGPRHARDVQMLPNRQYRLTSSYHDHTRGISRLNAYAGLLGPYFIRGFWERLLPLPDGEHDVPLVLADRTFDEDGSLHYPDEFVPNFAGDTPTVNGAAWPYMEVEPRPYRFRVLNVSNGRTYGLGLTSDEDGSEAPSIYQFSSGHGYLDDVATIGHGGDMEKLVLTPFERADVIVDFSDNAGETLTVTNDAEFPFSGGGHGGGHGDGGMDGGDMDGGMDDGGMDDGGMDGGMGGGHGGGDHPTIHEIMQFRVSASGAGRHRSVDPTALRLPNRRRARRRHRQPRTTREISLEMEMGSSPALHTLNGKRWGDPIEIEPQLGSTEIWELTNNSMHTHPVHLHMVTYEVLGRGPDGTAPPYPNETGPRDIVRVDPDETVRIEVTFGDFPGKFPFHCHVLEHEEHDMMRPFEVVTGRGRRD